MSSPAVTPKGAATRAFLLQIAAELFAERGYAETTMAQLIARSGLTKGAFYFHFSSKEQLALAVIEEKQRQWIDSVVQAISAASCVRPAAGRRLGVGEGAPRPERFQRLSAHP